MVPKGRETLLLPGSSEGAASPLAGSAATSVPAPLPSLLAAQFPGTSGSTALTAPAAPASVSLHPTCQRGTRLWLLCHQQALPKALSKGSRRDFLLVLLLEGVCDRATLLKASCPAQLLVHLLPVGLLQCFNGCREMQWETRDQAMPAWAHLEKPSHATEPALGASGSKMCTLHFFLLYLLPSDQLPPPRIIPKHRELLRRLINGVPA